MKDLILSIVKIGLPLSVAASMFAQGLSIVRSHFALFKERPWVMFRSLVAVLVLVPIASLVIIVLMKPSPAVAVGLAILVAAPAAPLLLVNVPKKGGTLAYMACLLPSLALLALLTVPITLHLLSKALGFQADVGVLAVGKVVGKTILLPVCLGVLIRSFFPRIADTIGPPLAKVAGVALLILIPFVVVMTRSLLLKMDLRSYLVMAVVVIVAIAIGHWLAPREPEEQTSLAMASAVRHPGVAMTIAALNFDPRKALAVLIPYLVVSAVITTIYLKSRKRRSGAPA